MSCPRRQVHQVVCVWGGGSSPFPSPPSSAQGGVQLLVKDLPLIALLATSRVVPELEYRWTQKLRFCLLRIPNCERSLLKAWSRSRVSFCMLRPLPRNQSFKCLPVWFSQRRSFFSTQCQTPALFQHQVPCDRNTESPPSARPQPSSSIR